VSEIALANSKRYEQPCADQIPAGATLYSEIHKPTSINSVWNKKELPEQWEEYITSPVYKNSK
jgi:hypothetical protein